MCNGAISQNREDWVAMTGLRKVVQHQDFGDGCVKLEMPLACPHGDVKTAGRYMSLEFRREVRLEI